MATAAPQMLDRHALPWIFTSAIVTTAPHVMHQPLWLSGVASLIFIWGAWLWWNARQLPMRWLLFLMVAFFTAGIVLEYRSIFGRDAGVAMLVGFMALKILEIKSRRDAHVIVILGYFLLLTHYLFSQSIPTGIWLLVAFIVLTATLIRIAGGISSSPSQTMRYAGLMTLQAIPLMLVLYLLLPRVSGPLWGLPKDAHKGSTGLSETMAPGNIAELAQSGAIAFRVQFFDAPPTHSRLYWRGPVLEDYDGSSWTPAPSSSVDTAPKIDPIGNPIRYAVTIEASNQAWLLALDAPISIPGESKFTRTLTVLAANPIQERKRFELSASPEFRFNVDETNLSLARSLRLPSQRNPKTLAMAATWRAESVRAEEIVTKALQHFRNEPFVYTLRPPLLGADAIDDFLFNTKRGFCEHYAAAFVVLMRASGVPARVVTGYQGGELNPLDGYMVVRQSDAHAWAEVWIAGKGWVRVDPTAAISPARIESGIAEALPVDEPLPALIQISSDWVRNLRFRWEAVNNVWNQWVLDYNPNRQRDLLSKLGIPNADWSTLGALLAGAASIVMLVLSAWTLYQRPRIDSARREWNKALRRLRNHGIAVESWEAPLALAQRVDHECPSIGKAFSRVAKHYCAARYADREPEFIALKAAVAALP